MHTLRIALFLLPGLLRAGTPADSWDKEVLPLLENYCFDCHGDGVSKGDLTFDDFDSIESMVADRERWKRIRTHLEQRLMPPVDEFQPKVEERETIVRWIDEAIFPVDPENPDPGRVTLRRLNRTEYENTLNDLLGIRVDVRSLLPPDDSGYGFDNIGDVLTLSPAHLERFLEAARVGLDKAVHTGPMPFPSRTLPGGELRGDGHRSDSGHFLTQNGAAFSEFRFPSAGRYQITIVAGETRAGGEHAKMEFRLGDKVVKEWEVDAPVDQPREHTTEVSVADRTPLRISAAFTNDFYQDRSQGDGGDRNLMIEALRVTGPLDGPREPKPASHVRIFGERPGDSADEDRWAVGIFKRFARRAFRRPPQDGEAERYLHFVRLAKEEGRDIEEGIRQGLEAMLLSPAFLFRHEPQPEPDNAERIHRIDEHTLASRLSYFLWSTMPDEHLMRLADEGKLRENLPAEIDRMLESVRANQLVENFAGQWLQLRDLRSARPSRKSYPRFDLRLKAAMRMETELLVAHLIRENRPLADLLSADYSFLNEPLARHYGVAGVKGNEFRKVSLKNTPRRGILGHGSFLLVTSHPLRTSPVLRGKYVLENLLDQAPPPPPPNVPSLTANGGHDDSLSLREQMVKHREDPGCASCHALMDPIGFGLENFDGDGSYRMKENGRPIDASGQLADGRKFQGSEELRRILLDEHRSDFHRSVASKMLTYALGRGTDWYDKPAIDAIVRETEAAGGGAREMVKAVIRSVPFQFRRGEG
ncbi:filamin [Haloferula helveola]|uniref:Filamin n=1 Tax=Haloferula helveola TaxID=490095 RepID=A0ABM7R7D0_9BACT|nr:filamin [Haloferula helveola]